MKCAVDDPSFKPSDVEFRSTVHFCILDTLGNTEREIAVGIIVTYLKENGDSWQRVTLPQIQEFLRPQQEKLNPFAPPDFASLEERGLAVRHEADDSLELTPKCLSLIRRPQAWKTEPH